MKHKDISYENRYKHKLNMLEPGLVMIKVIGVLLCVGVFLWAVGWRPLSIILFILAGGVFITLLILIIIEAHQDKVLNDIAMHENKEKYNDNIK